MEKLQSSRGETLVEVMAAILIAALSVTLLFSCIMATSTMNKNAEKLDNAHYGAFTDADTQASAATTPTPGFVRIEATPPSPGATSVVVTPPITIYGGEGMYSYKR